MTDQGAIRLRTKQTFSMPRIVFMYPPFGKCSEDELIEWVKATFEREPLKFPCEITVSASTSYITGFTGDRAKIQHSVFLVSVPNPEPKFVPSSDDPVPQKLRPFLEQIFQAMLLNESINPEDFSVNIMYGDKTFEVGI